MSRSTVLWLCAYLTAAMIRQVYEDVTYLVKETKP